MRKLFPTFQPAVAVDGDEVTQSIEFHESRRLKALATYEIVGKEQQPRLQRVARSLAKVLKVELVVVVLVPETGVQDLASTSPTPLPMSQRNKSLATLCVERGGLVEVPDVLAHPLLFDHPFVTGPLACRSAIGVPFCTPDGWWLGSISVWDATIRRFSDNEKAVLADFADMIAEELELHKTLLEQKRQRSLLQAMFDTSAIGISVYDNTYARVAINRAFCEMFGYEPHELIGKTPSDVDIAGEDGVAKSGLAQVLAGKLASCNHEGELRHKSGAKIWCRFTVSRLDIPEIDEPFAIAYTENVNDRRQAEQARTLLLGEINHRVKNTLAIVQGIAKQLLRTSPDPATFAVAFETRVQCVARSHDMLTKASWEPLPLREIFDQLLRETWEPYSDQIEFHGPNIPLNAQTTVMIGLLLNELLTNAVKHGALKSPAGRIRLEADLHQREGEPWTDITWSETSDQPIAPTSRRGLGMYLLDRAPRLGLSGTGTLRFNDCGLCYHVSFPVREANGLFQQGLAVH